MRREGGGETRITLHCMRREEGGESRSQMGGGWEKHKGTAGRSKYNRFLVSGTPPYPPYLVGADENNVTPRVLIVAEASTGDREA